MLCGMAEKRDGDGKWVAMMVRGGGYGAEAWTPNYQVSPRR